MNTNKTEIIISSNKKWLPILIVFLAWFALISQFGLIILNRVVSISETIIRYFSYFTILSNLLVALCFTFILFKRKSALGDFFSRATTLTAITVYILLVGIVYNVILRFLWQPQGLQLVVDEVLHTVIPLACVIFWWINISGKNLKWKNAFPWLLYPLLYISYSLIHGKISGFYPYPFIDVNASGYKQVLINSATLACCFLVVSWILIAITKMRRQ